MIRSPCSAYYAAQTTKCAAVAHPQVPLWKQANGIVDMGRQLILTNSLMKNDMVAVLAEVK